MSDCSTDAFKAKKKRMTLDEAISFLTYQLLTHDYGCDECRDEHVQLRCWLIELREARERYAVLGCIACEMLDTMRKISREVLRIRFGRRGCLSCLDVLVKNIIDARARYANRLKERGVTVDE